MTSLRRRAGGLLALALTLLLAAGARAAEPSECRLKAAFIFNFMVYTEWPAGSASNLLLCVQGAAPLGAEIGGLHGKTVAGRTLVVVHKSVAEPLAECDVVFVAASAMAALPRTLEGLRRRPVLTLADSAGAMRQGVMLNMNMAGDKVSFEANLLAARSAGLSLSSKLLRLATEVQQ